MKVLMLGKLNLFDAGGGDRVQIENTAKELRKLGVEVDIKAGFNNKYEDYDLVHIFQLDWTPESNLYARAANRYNLPIVLSPIHHSVKEVKYFDDVYAFDFRRLSKLLLKEQHSRDTLKNIYRSIFDSRKVKPTIISIYRGLKKMHKETLKLSDIVLTQTVLEAEDLMSTYNVNIKWEKVTNGVGELFINNTNYEKILNYDKYLISVGRIEPRKNQLNIIKAVEKLRFDLNEDIQMVFIGKKNPIKHYEYTQRFLREIKNKSWVHQIDYVDYVKLPSYYHFAKVCISASWFETTGLTSLEALFCGTNTVASGERAREYLGNWASYCSPDNYESIYEAIKNEYFRERPDITQDYIFSYTWENAAKKTLEVYESLIKSK